jgi:hypothetical protein
MQGLLSNRWLIILGSLVFMGVAYLLLIPYGLPWTAVGLLGPGLACAMWVKKSAPQSMTQVLQEVEAERMPRVRAGVPGSPTLVWLCIASSSLLAGTSLGATVEPGANLSACKTGLASCQRSALTLVEMTEVAVARNLSNCRASTKPCDPSALTPSEARDMAGRKQAADGRNFADCLQGRDQCYHSLLTRAEAQDVARAEHGRNYTACLSRQGSCDRLRLTPDEAASIPPLTPPGQ